MDGVPDDECIRFVTKSVEQHAPMLLDLLLRAIAGAGGARRAGGEKLEVGTNRGPKSKPALWM